MRRSLFITHGIGFLFMHDVIHSFKPDIIVVKNDYIEVEDIYERYKQLEEDIIIKIQEFPKIKNILYFEENPNDKYNKSQNKHRQKYFNSKMNKFHRSQNYRKR